MNFRLIFYDLGGFSTTWMDFGLVFKLGWVLDELIFGGFNFSGVCEYFQMHFLEIW